VDESVIHREEVAALLFAVYDMVDSLAKIEILLGGGDDGEEGEAGEG
jgi:hypothetical protein